MRRALAIVTVAATISLGAPSAFAEEPFAAAADPIAGSPSSSTDSTGGLSELPGILGRSSGTGFSPLVSPAVSSAVTKGNTRSGVLGFGAEPSAARDDPKGVPSVDEAFRPSVQALDAGTLAIAFDIGRCCYLYRDRIAVRGLDGASLGAPDFPDGERYSDEFYGETVIYRDALEFRVPVLARTAGDATTLALEIDYQGCSDAGVCYPPETRRLIVGLPGASISSAASAVMPELSTSLALQAASATASATASDSLRPRAAAYVSEQDRLESTLVARGLLALPLFFGLGVLLAFTPCVLPMVPILSGIIGAQGSIGTGRAFALSSVYVLVMAATYAALGVLAAASGANLQAAFQHPAIIAVSVALFIALALAMFGLYTLELPRAWQQRLVAASGRQKGGEFLGVGLMGGLSALIVGPCVAAPLIGVLGYIAASGDLAIGALTLFVMGLGMGLPLIVVGTSAGRLVPRAGPWTRTIKAGLGVGLLAVAIWMLERIVPPALTLALWATLATVLAVFLGVGRTVEPHPVRLLGKGLGLALALYGALLLVGVATGARNPLRPLESFTLAAVGGEGGAALAAAPRFDVVTTGASFDAELASARANGRPLMLDFYADWCVTCKEMERYTFADPAVAAAMRRFDLVKADVTANDAGNRELLARFSLLGPPAILFFDADGQEQTTLRTVGFLDAERFLVVVDAALAESKLASATVDTRSLSSLSPTTDSPSTDR